MSQTQQDPQQDPQRISGARHQIAVFLHNSLGDLNLEIKKYQERVNELKSQNVTNADDLRKWVEHVFQKIDLKHEYWPTINRASDLLKQKYRLDIEYIHIIDKSLRFLRTVSPENAVRTIASVVLELRNYVIPDGDDELSWDLLDDIRHTIEMVVKISNKINDMVSFVVDTHNDNCSIERELRKICAGSETTESFNVDYNETLFKCWNNGAGETRRQYNAQYAEIMRDVGIAKASLIAILKKNR